MSGLAASPLGVLIGLVTGAFGGGGSVVAIPILVYLVDQDLRSAQSTALAIVAGASVVGLWLHRRRGGRVRWRAGASFGAAVAVAAMAASIASRSIDPNLLLLLFVPVMLAAAASLVAERVGTDREMTPWRYGVSLREVAKVIAIGALAGGIIGFFGVGGGFIVVPALVLLLGFTTPEAVATALLVVLMGSAPALGERIASGDVDWSVVIPFSVAATAGVFGGERAVERYDAAVLKRAFALVVVAAAIYTGISSAVKLG